MQFCPTAPRTSNWLVIRTHPHRERFAADQLGRQGFESYCPVVLKRIRHARRVYDAKRPLFPSYIFVKHAGAQMRWRPILSTQGVRTLIQHSGSPGLLDGAFIETLRQREVDGVIQRDDARLRVGQRVAIDSGGFSGLVGEILDVRDHRRIAVLLDLMNNKVRAHVGIDKLSTFPT